MDLERRQLGLGRRPALVLVDLMRGFTDPLSPLGTDCPSVVEANAELLRLFRERSLPRFFTAVVYRNADQASVFRRRINALNVLQPGAPWVEIDPRLAPQEGEPVVEKRCASAFFGTDLAPRLAAARADSLIVTGLTTSGCVRATAVDGLQHNYRVAVPREAVGDRNPSAHEANLFDLDAKYADVLSLQETLNMVAKEAAKPLRP